MRSGTCHLNGPARQGDERRSLRPNIAQQCLNLDRLDEIRIHLVPVFLGEGVRYFEHIHNENADLERVEAGEGEGVMHLRYRVRYH